MWGGWEGRGLLMVVRSCIVGDSARVFKGKLQK